MRAHSAVHQNSGILTQNFLNSTGTLTLNYFPGESDGGLGRADIAGRDAAQTAVWRLLRAPFYAAAQEDRTSSFFQRRYGLKQAVTWRIGFAEEGSGTITIDINAVLVQREHLVSCGRNARQIFLRAS